MCCREKYGRDSVILTDVKKPSHKVYSEGLFIVFMCVCCAELLNSNSSDRLSVFGITLHTRMVASRFSLQQLNCVGLKLATQQLCFLVQGKLELSWQCVTNVG